MSSLDILLDQMKKRNKDKVKIWVKDADNKYEDLVVDKDDLCLIDIGLTWGFVGWIEDLEGLLDFDYSDDDFAISIEDINCRSPFDHIFKKRTLCTSNYTECLKCGYSPDLDSNKPEFERTHREYLEFRKRNDRN